MQVALAFTPADREARLAQLGLKGEWITSAVQNGFVSRSWWTLNHPAFVEGILWWAETIARLRETLAPFGWWREDLRNYALCVNPAGTTAIAVSSGNSATGHRGLTPRTNAAKGASTIEAVDDNCQQLELDLPGVESNVVIDAATPRKTWILLVHRSDSEVRYELALPVHVDDQRGFVDRWAERILFDPIDLGRAPPPLLGPGPDDESGPAIDIPITRRL